MGGQGPAISEEDLERLADRVAERVAVRLASSESRNLLDAAAIAVRFSLSRSWVYDHARELGVIRVGAGPRARLRFDPDIVRESLSKLDADVPSIARSPRHRRRTANPRSDLLPVRGRAPRN